MRKPFVLIGVLVLSLAMATSVAFAQGGSSGGMVRSIASAPINPDGTTAGSFADFVITLDTSLDPEVPGRTLLQGGTIKIALPASMVFENPDDFPVKSVGSSNCAPGNLQCSTGVLLQGWPQHPIAPPPNYALSYDAATHSIIYTALQDLIPAPPLEPGLKQMHLILQGFRNPKPGHYAVHVAAETGPGGAMEYGIGDLHIVPKSRPSINVTSAYNPGAPNTIYQSTAPGQDTPLPYDFLLWDHRGVPFEGVTIEAVSSSHSLLRQGRRTVGHVYIDAPPGATGQQVVDLGPSYPWNSPVLGVPTARLTVQFQAGSATGEYILTFAMNGGNSVQMFVTAE